MAFERILERRLTKECVDTLVSHELDRILQTCQPQKVFLFGSAARNEATDSSDLDFLIVLNDQDNLKKLKKIMI